MTAEEIKVKIALNKEDVRNLRSANRKCGYASPRFNRKGCMIGAQWKSWKKLQASGLAIMEFAGNGAEVDDLVITQKGRNVLRKLVVHTRCRAFLAVKGVKL